MLREAMERALEELPARYAMILRMRYGIDGDKPRTLEYIAQKLSLSRERVRQIERDAFSRLRLQEDVRKQRLPAFAANFVTQRALLERYEPAREVAPGDDSAVCLTRQVFSA
jgi:hypothetical protein